MRMCLPRLYALGPTEPTALRTSETSNVASLSTVPPVEPGIVDGGLAPGPVAFATMLMFVPATGWDLACYLCSHSSPLNSIFVNVGRAQDDVCLMWRTDLRSWMTKTEP